MPNAFLQHLHGGVVAGWEGGEEGEEGEGGEDGGEGGGGEEGGEEGGDAASAASMVKRMRIDPEKQSEDPRVRQGEWQVTAGEGQAQGQAQGGGGGGDGVGEAGGEGELQAAAFNFEGSVRVWSDYLQAALVSVAMVHAQGKCRNGKCSAPAP